MLDATIARPRHLRGPRESCNAQSFESEVTARSPKRRLFIVVYAASGCVFYAALMQRGNRASFSVRCGCLTVVNRSVMRSGLFIRRQRCLVANDIGGFLRDHQHAG